METSEGLHTFSRSDNPNIMVSFAEEPLFKKKKRKYCKLGYERHFCSSFCTLPPALRCWKVSHALTGTSAIPLPSLEKQQCNLGELYKMSGWEDTGRARLLPFFLFGCIGPKSKVLKVHFQNKLRKPDHRLKKDKRGGDFRRWCFPYDCMVAYCEGLRRL